MGEEGEEEEEEECEGGAALLPLLPLLLEEALAKALANFRSCEATCGEPAKGRRSAAAAAAAG